MEINYLNLKWSITRHVKKLSVLAVMCFIGSNLYAQKSVRIGYIDTEYVLENIDDYDQPIVSYPGELIPNDEFYSYKAKYIMKDGAKLQIPAVLDDSITNAIREKAGEIFKTLECNCLARVDFFLENKTNKLFFSLVQL